MKLIIKEIEIIRKCYFVLLVNQVIKVLMNILLILIFFKEIVNKFQIVIFNINKICLIVVVNVQIIMLGNLMKMVI